VLGRGIVFPGLEAACVMADRLDYEVRFDVQEPYHIEVRREKCAFRIDAFSVLIAQRPQEFDAGGWN
jgi:hypothetical protein